MLPETNNFMMVMTLVTVLFAPITFISSYFGMNFAGGNGLDHPFKFCKSQSTLSKERLADIVPSVWWVSIPVLIFFTLLVFSFMLWDSIGDFFKKRGLQAHRHKRGGARQRHWR